MNAFTQKGDTVLTFTPDFSMYAFYSALIECPCVQMPKRADATIDVDAAIARANEDNARLILFSNPCNPTSVGLAPEEVVRLIAACPHWWCSMRLHGFLRAIARGACGGV
jgi:histidinol-phosphate aminotransferase